MNNVTRKVLKEPCVVFFLGTGNSSIVYLTGTFRDHNLFYFAIKIFSDMDIEMKAVSCEK